MHDHRGWNIERFNEGEFDIKFVTDSISKSKSQTFRGLHGDSKTWKLIECLFGRFWLIIYDNRKDSPTYKNWTTSMLTGFSGDQILLPPGVANGHYCFEDCLFSYKMSHPYTQIEDQFTIKWHDENLSEVPWPWEIEPKYISERDR